MHALTRFLGLVEPYALVRISVIPASSTQGRTLFPAVTPVPGRAGTSTTVLAPLVPFTVCGIVVPFRFTLNICLRASLLAFSTAGGTSFALPYPIPIFPRRSPETTRAPKLNVRPPLTTLEQR